MKNKFLSMLFAFLLGFVLSGCGDETEGEKSAVTPPGKISGDIRESGTIILRVGMGGGNEYAYTYSNKTFPAVILPTPRESDLIRYEWGNAGSPLVGYAYFLTEDSYEFDYCDKNNCEISYGWIYSDRDYLDDNLTLARGWNFIRWEPCYGVENAVSPAKAEWVARLVVYSADSYNVTMNR